MLVDEGTQRATPRARSARPTLRSSGGRRDGRVITPVRGLPNGRAVLGGLLVALAALGSYLLARSGGAEATAPYVVAARDLAPGMAVAAGDLRVVALHLPPEQARGTFPSVAALTGAVMRGPLQAGAVVTASSVDRPPNGGTAGAPDQAGGAASQAYRELSVDLPAARAVGGALRPGDRVDVVATADAASHVLVQQALVLASAGGKDGRPLGGGEMTVTLALPDAAAALAVAHGAAAAELTLLRSTRATEPLPQTYQLPGAGRTGTGTTTGTSAAATAGTTAAATTGR